MNVRVTVNSAGIVQRMKERENLVSQRMGELAYTLAKQGSEVVRTNLSRAEYDGDERVGVAPEKRATGAAVLATGQAITFLEFGAGVRYGEGYPGTRPPGIVGIGQYGQGHGANIEGWTFIDAAGNMQHTYGNAPYAPMYYAAKTMATLVEPMARMVFV